MPVQSTQDNLQALALAVASGIPVLLQGPVGCGKTALVEQLATCMGRAKCPELIKVQLGDQMDSKVDPVEHRKPSNIFQVDLF